MRVPFFPCILALVACATGDQQAARIPTGPTAGWGDDGMWAVLDAQDHRDRSALVGYLKHPRPDLRERAALAFASSPDSLAIPALIGALADTHPQVRKAVAVAIGNASNSAGWAALTKASDAEKDTSVLRVMIEQAFKAEVDLRRAMEPTRLFQLLGTGNVSIRVRAAQQLARMTGEKMSGMETELLEACGREADPAVRMFLVASLKHFRTDAVKTALMRWALSDSLPTIRISALQALGAREDASLSSFFLERTNDGVQAVRFTAVEQLERIPEPLDAQAIWESAQQQGDPFTQIPLYGLVLKHGEASQRLIARKLLEAQAALENMPYAEAMIMEAQAKDPDGNVAADILEPRIDKAVSSLERITAFREAMDHYTDRSVPQVELLSRVLRTTDDPGMIAELSDAIAAREAYNGGDPGLAKLLVQARSRLVLPRDLEASRGIDKALARLRGQATPSAEPPGFNHPIDRARLVALKDGQRYRIMTTKGDIGIALEPMAAPGSCVAFDSLVTAAFYNGKFFHRVVPNFVAQGGCPRGDGYGSMNWTLRTEVGYEGFTKGAVGLASAGRDTESCQFFIMTSAAPHLDGRYTRFAHVVEGQDVADVLAVGDMILAVQKE
jgi:cyclophilin family peptidyl-prolyl cis-trans isomerase/HEAT repeat protein